MSLSFRTTPIASVHVGMRMRSTVQPEGNQVIVTEVTPDGFSYRIADDEEPINPHWSMQLAREGHMAIAIDGAVHWEPVLS